MKFFFFSKIEICTIENTNLTSLKKTTEKKKNVPFTAIYTLVDFFQSDE